MPIWILINDGANKYQNWSTSWQRVPTLTIFLNNRQFDYPELLNIYNVKLPPSTIEPVYSLDKDTELYVKGEQQQS